jgi:hypothetical protein
MFSRRQFITTGLGGMAAWRCWSLHATPPTGEPTAHPRLSCVPRSARRSLPCSTA